MVSTEHGLVRNDVGVRPTRGPVLRETASALSANLVDRFFSLDAWQQFRHSVSTSGPALRRVFSKLMFAFSRVRCVANLLTSLFSNFNLSSRHLAFCGGVPFRPRIRRFHEIDSQIR